MGVGITVVGPRKLDYPAGLTQHETKPFRAAEIEFETNPLGSKSTTVSFGILVELQLADAILVVGLARDLIPHKIMQEVNLHTWGSSFEDYSSRPGMKLLLDTLSANVLPMVVGRDDRTSIGRLRGLIQSPPFTVQPAKAIDIGWTLGANIRPETTYDEARDSIAVLLAWFSRDPFMYVTNVETRTALSRVHP